MPRWQHAGRVVLFNAVNDLLTHTAAHWAGAALDDDEVPRRAHELAEMRNRAGTVGPASWWARTLRIRAENWARTLVDQVRAGLRSPPTDSALAIIAAHRDPDGTQLDSTTAAVELLNVLPPIAAVSRYVVFAALASVQHPNWARAFAAGKDARIDAFVHEVRRTAPFFPLVAGRVREPFSWHDHDFTVGERVYLDLYGTNHDPRLWPDPQAFTPERFIGWRGDPYSLIPQGGGDYATDHRCPGEPITNRLLVRAVRLLTRATRYDVGMQLRPSMRFVMSPTSSRRTSSRCRVDSRTPSRVGRSLTPYSWSGTGNHAHHRRRPIACAALGIGVIFSEPRFHRSITTSHMFAGF